MKINFFVGRLRCPACGTVSEPNSRTDMQTYLTEGRGLAELGVGHPLVLPDDVEDYGYIRLRDSAADEAVRLAETWTCPSCSTRNLWAVVVIHQGRIQHVEAIDLHQDLASLHLVGQDAMDHLDPDDIETLRQRSGLA